MLALESATGVNIVTMVASHSMILRHDVEWDCKNHKAE